eukprot:TRINITY_DN1392_c0_g7_i1.p1 TRINITY_DN1392_c0_g7~~TRINITY_DN1392_c0_g7_i1.p1  ORF type:complete len:276 (+),score=125.57 TRINITY_DN1392_c0_g7_i1:312-1139(+)
MNLVVLAAGTALGHGLLSEATKDVITELYKKVRGLVSHPEVHKVFEELDLEAQLEVVESLLVEMGKFEYENSAISLAFTNVYQSLNKIKGILNQIHEEIELHHQTKWFASWRTPNYESLLSKLKKTKKIMDERVEILIKLILITPRRSPSRLLRLNDEQEKKAEGEKEVEADKKTMKEVKEQVKEQEQEQEREQEQEKEKEKEQKQEEEKEEKERSEQEKGQEKEKEGENEDEVQQEEKEGEAEQAGEKGGEEKAEGMESSVFITQQIENLFVKL